MKNLKKSINSYSFTEKLIFSLIFFLVFALAFAFVSDESGALKTVLGQETSDSSEASVDSGDDSESVDSSDEESVEDSTSLSVDSIDEVSVDDDTTESVDEADEISTASQDVSVSGGTELSVESEDGTSVSDFESIVQIDGNRVVASESGRLFYLIPVKINKTLSLNDQGDIIDIQQTLFSRLLELLSF